MFRRTLAFAFCAVSLMAAPAEAAPKTDRPGETVTIPFDPPLDGTVKYRWQRTEDRDGKVTMSWAVNQFSFKQTDDGHRLMLEPVSSGSNETDPEKLRIMAKLHELLDLPYALKINEDAEIVELESDDEYWAKIFQALRETIARDNPKPDEKKAIEGVIALFEGMPAEVKLAKLTESVQPLVEFGNVELTVGEPVAAQVDTASPFGGGLKQDVVVTLNKVVDDIAFVTIRTTVPREEFAKLVGSMFDKIGEVSAKAEPDKLKKELAAAEQLKFETVADYQVSASDGLLRSFEERRTIIAKFKNEGGRQIRTTTLVRVD